MVGGLVLTVFLSVLILLVPGKASAVYECWVKIKGADGRDINGESTVKGKENWIEIISWSLSGNVPTDPQSGLPTGKKIMKPLNLTMRTSKASPLLMQTLNTGLQLSVTLTARKPGTSGDYLIITLTDALIVSFVNLGNSKSTEAYPIEEILLTYKRMVIQYRQPMPDGTLGPPVEVPFEWQTPRA